MAYTSVKAEVNSKSYPAVQVNVNGVYTTYLDWAVARDLKLNITKAVYNDVEINGVKPPQVADSATTYIQYDKFGVDFTVQKLDGGGFNFTTSSGSTTTSPATTATGSTPPSTDTHSYTMLVTEPSTAVAGTWAPIVITTMDNGKPLGSQVITIDQNGVQVCKDTTDATNGGYEWDITETSDKTDTMTVSWTDPAGKVHTVTNTTAFEVPQASATPTPSDDSTVVVATMLPDSDPSDAVFFEITAPNGQSIEVQLDTGAFELMFTTSTAATLGLQNEGSLTVSGVGGTASAYYSSASFSINGVQFSDIPCIVEDSFTGKPLFGYKFFVDNGYDLLVSQKHNTITIMK